MKRIICMVLPFLLLLGCQKTEHEMDQLLKFREELLKSERISFDTTVTADYGEEIYEFSLHCETDDAGNFLFCVEKPASIRGITGMITSEGGNLTFDAEVLAFALIADGQISPVGAPWVFLKALRSGYIHAATALDHGLFAELHDTYEENALKFDVTFQENTVPIFAEIYWNQRRIISLKIDNFDYV